MILVAKGSNLGRKSSTDASDSVKKIGDERGSVMHMMRADSPWFSRFGEIYFSTVKSKVVKAWRYI